MLYSILNGREEWTDKFYKIYPYQWIKQNVTNKFDEEEKDIQSASLDLPLGNQYDIILYPNEEIVCPLMTNGLFNRHDFYLLEKSTTARLGIEIIPVFNKESSIIKLKLKSSNFIIHIPRFSCLVQAVFFDKNQSIEPQKLILDICNEKRYMLNKGFISLKDYSRDRDNYIEQSNTFITAPVVKYLAKSKTQLLVNNSEVGFLNSVSNTKKYTLDNTNTLTKSIGAGFIDPGFNAQLTYEIKKTPNYIKEDNTEISGKDKFATINIVPLTEPTEKPYNGNYANGKILPKQIKHC